MNTGVDNYYDMIWTLRAIKKEQSLTPAGEIVKIDIDKLTKRDPDAPSMDTIGKCIRLLESQDVFRVEKKLSKNVAYPFEPVNSNWNWATFFELAINQEIFDTTYNSYVENPTEPIDLKSDEATTSKVKMPPEKKLKAFKNKISSATKLNAELNNLISIELYDFIQGDTLLKECFHQHLDYLKNLAVKKDFIELQSKYIVATIQVLKLTNIEKIEELQNEFDNKVLNRLKTGTGYLTLPELYVALQNKENYYRLGDHSYTAENELSWLTHVVPTLNQLDSIDAYITRISFNIFGEDSVLQNKAKNPLDKYDVLKLKIRELVYNMAIKLHVKEFERFFLFCAETRPIYGYEGLYEINRGTTRNASDAGKVWENIKKYSESIIDDLIEDIERVPVEVRTENSLSPMEKSVKSIGAKSKVIEAITFEKPDNDGKRLRVAVNNDYENALRVNLGKYWKNLFQIARGAGKKPGTELPEGDELLSAVDDKPTMDYFNTNKDCKLYTTSAGYKVTKILQADGHGLIEPAIKIGVVNHKAFEQRKNEQSRKTA